MLILRPRQSVLFCVLFLAACQGDFTSSGGRANDIPDPNQPIPQQPVASCASCHPSMDSDNAAWRTMSGTHSKHLRMNNVTCADCHVEVTTTGRIIENSLLHQNDTNNVAFVEPDMTFNSNNLTCSGSCHNEKHENDDWNDDD